MSRFARLVPRGIEGQYFKAVPDGWLFGAPRPWLAFGRRPTYRVTDAQKAALAARIRLSRAWRLILGIPLALATPLWIELPRGMSITDRAMLALGLYLTAVHLLEYLMVRPLVADLPRATEQMNLADMLRQQSASMSIRSQAMIGGFFGLFTLLGAVGAAFSPPVDRPLFWEIVQVSGFFAVIWIGLLIIKRRNSSQPSQPLN